jgi:hypothetical protein
MSALETKGFRFRAPTSGNQKTPRQGINTPHIRDSIHPTSGNHYFPRVCVCVCVCVCVYVCVCGYSGDAFLLVWKPKGNQGINTVADSSLRSYVRMATNSPKLVYLIRVYTRIYSRVSFKKIRADGSKCSPTSVYTDLISEGQTCLWIQLNWIIRSMSALRSIF